MNRNLSEKTGAPDPGFPKLDAIKPDAIKPGTRITAMGLGHFGGQIAAIKYCAELGADILVTDRSSDELLVDSVARLQGYPHVSFRFGQHHPEDFVDADLILVSPAVKPSHPCLRAAEEKGIPVLTEIELFLANCSAKIIAVSGSVGKSTTVSMIEHLLLSMNISVHVGGNIGNSLLPHVNEISDRDWVILELSSFQLHWLSRRKYSFEVAVLTNYFPHHLDWHGGEENYRACKQSLLRNQDVTQLAVLPASFRENGDWRSQATPVYFGNEDLAGLPECWPVHDRRNAAAAYAAVKRIGDLQGGNICWEDAASLLKDYRGLPHRMEFVAEREGRRFINDSKATCPHAAIAALRSMTEPTWLILGGALLPDDLEGLIGELKTTSILRGIACVGPTGQRIFQRLKPILSKQKKNVLCQLYPSLKPAVQWCWESSKSGDSILLSPGCPSYDEFQNYEQRGNNFAKFAKELKSHS